LIFNFIVFLKVKRKIYILTTFSMNARAYHIGAFDNIVLNYTKVLFLSLFFLAGFTPLNHIAAQCTLGCNDNVQVSLNSSCTAEVTVAMISPSAGSSCPGGNFKVIVMNTNGQTLATSPFVNVTEIGKKLMVKVMDTNSGQSCWGSILVEDKLPPIITACNDQTINCSSNWLTPGVVIAPTFTDNCSNATISFVDVVNDIPCGTGAFTATIARTYTVTDASGNKATCTKNIFVQRGNINDITWPRHRDGIQAPTIDCGNPNINPSNTGEPTMYGGPIVMMCDLMATYTDQVKDIAAGVKVILRTWVVIDWCTGEAKSFVQNIRIVDTTPPSITCPNSLTVNTSTVNCTANYTFPNFNVTDDCSPAAKITRVVAVNGFIVNAPTATGLPIGTHTIMVTAIDDANNTSNCTYTVTVVDNVPPVAVCDEFTKVSLGLDGTAEINAITFDDGSVDNCEIDRFEVARVGTTVSFGPKVKFTCQDVNQTINIILRVWDKSGNYNDCTVDVKIEDKLNPKLTCPPDITMACQSDYNNLTLTGKAVATDNCNVTVANIDLVQVNNCGVGTIKRTWVATDDGGRTSACIQYITLQNNTPFFINQNNPNDPNDDVTWPADFTASGCGPNLLPAAAGAPIIKKDDCDQIAVTYEDTELPLQGGGCLKILRKWIVVDWCQYQANVLPLKGFYTYTQTIKVVNNDPPTLSIPCKDVTFYTDNSNCTGQKLNYVVSATDDCTESSKLQWTTKVDFNCNGNVDEIGVTGDLSYTYPVGTHCIYIGVEDGCGNIRTCSYKLTLIDGKKPTPVCHHGLSTTLMATGSVTIDAKLFDGGSFDNCTAATDLKFDVKPNTFTCKELGPNLVTFTVTDKAGNSDFCTTYIDIQDNMKMCPPGSSVNTASIAGAIKTSAGNGVENVGLKVDGTMSAIMTSKAGDFLLYKTLGQKYDVAPEKNDDVQNGVSTLDIVKISKHILGTEILTTPYAQIAADVNKNNTISTADIIALRKVILGIEKKFPAPQQSWRFIKSDFTFPNPANAFETAFPEVANVSLVGNANTDFVAVKVGDINNSATTSNITGNASSRGVIGTVTMNLDEQALVAGKTYRFPVTLNAEELAGLQFTMNYDNEKLELVNILNGDMTDMSVANYAVPQEGIITASWNTQQANNSAATFFTLVMKAKEDGMLSESIVLNSTATPAEAYTTDEEDLEVTLKFKVTQNVANTEQGLTLYQNQPNPFSETTNIRFFIPEKANATIKIMDITGKMVRQWSDEYSKGYHTLSMNKNELTNASSGIFYYQIQTANATATKKMIIVE
jgi:Secretion system C-terminal sorting domain/Cohesin domain/HYR domain